MLHKCANNLKSRVAANQDCQPASNCPGAGSSTQAPISTCGDSSVSTPQLLSKEHAGFISFVTRAMKRFVVAIAVAILLAAGRTTPIGPGQSEIQVPLHHGPPNLAAQPSPYMIVEVGEDVCEAGSRQWAGSVNVSEGNALFFCEFLSRTSSWSFCHCCPRPKSLTPGVLHEAGFFESRNTPKDDPIIVWIDGCAIPRKNPAHTSLRYWNNVLMKSSIVVPAYLQ